jgi:hypothetical protein
MTSWETITFLILGTLLSLHSRARKDTTSTVLYTSQEAPNPASIYKNGKLLRSLRF